MKISEHVTIWILAGFLIGMQFSCQTKSKPTSEEIAVAINEDEYKNAPVEVTTVKDNFLAEFPEKIHLLLPGLYHGEDIFRGAAQKHWYGIYRKGSIYQIKRTMLTFDAAFDPILDDDGEKSALSIHASEDSQDLIFLIADDRFPGGLIERQIYSWNDAARPWPFSLEPGHSMRIDEAHRLDVHGEEMKDYRIDFVVEHNKIQSQAIANADELDDTYMSLLWSGDLNGDGLPDLLMNISPNYSYSHMALFLSKAEAGDHLNLVAEFKFTGC